MTVDEVDHLQMDRVLRDVHPISFRALKRDFSDFMGAIPLVGWCLECLLEDAASYAVRVISEVRAKDFRVQLGQIEADLVRDLDQPSKVLSARDLYGDAERGGILELPFRWGDHSGSGGNWQDPQPVVATLREGPASIRE